MLHEYQFFDDIHVYDLIRYVTYIACVKYHNWIMEFGIEICEEVSQQVYQRILSFIWIG